MVELQSTWTWLPAIYLFLGGVSAGAMLIVALLKLAGRGRFKTTITVGSWAFKVPAASCGSFFHWLYAGLDPAPFGPFYPVSFSVFCIWKNMENPVRIDRSSRNRDYIWRSGDFGLAGNPASVPGTAASGGPSAPVDHGF